MRGLLNHVFQAINRNQQNIGFVQLGIVTSVNATNSSIKVMIQPEQYETGFIPYSTPWIGWYSPPHIGDQVVVIYQEGNKDVAIGAFSLYWSQAQPPSINIQDGEAILHHTNGSYIYLKNSGDIDINATGNVNVTSPQTNISNNGTTDYLVLYTNLKTAFDNHIHSGVSSGSANSGVPVTPLPTNTATTTLKAQ